MKLCVSHIIDTTFLFTPTSTPTFKPSLRFLAKEVLNKTIQTSPCGHDSIEDAKVCMELLLTKLQRGPEYSVSWHEDKRSIVDYMGYCGVNSLLVDHQALLGKHVKTQNVKCSFAIGDDSIVSNTIEGLNSKSYDFIWLQMHDFHTFCKKEYEEGKEVSSEEVRKLLASMLQLIEVLFNRASPGTMFIVCAGSGNLQGIKQFNAKRDQNMEKLKVLVEKARKGIAFFKFKPHQDSTTNPEY
ncbi:Small RNA degrading nuclease 5-like [Oopsacas minuta]|uniref:Small RNA degrading nuclease 5-like n=1 Tax=Oopsacas minuta TaxID=111878 RepID=A0AAV7JAZ5_9METZ|nr:Small RNA degrading nuclease 5-like [Oopsacas minuta]